MLTVNLRAQLSRRLKWLSNRWKWEWSPRQRHSCLKCGFFSVNRAEAGTDVRILVAARGEAGWFTKETVINCYRSLWFWEVGDDVVVDEANKPRFSCRGFRRHTPGRSPEWHLDQDDKDREFRQKLVLVIAPSVVAPLFALLGNLLGGLKLALSAGAIALIGAVVAFLGLRHH